MYTKCTGICLGEGPLYKLEGLNITSASGIRNEASSSKADIL